MAAPRPYWKGQLRLSLVSFPVELYTATASAEKISFHQIHEPSGKRVRHEKTVPGVGPVSTDEIVKGFEYDKGNYVLLSDEELDAVKLETRKAMELVQFVDYDEVDPRYFERPYYMVPGDDQAEEAFRVIRDALRESRKMGLGKLAIRGREYLAAVKPCSTGLLLETLRFAEEVRQSDTFFRDISEEPPPEELLDVAKQLIARKTAPFDASTFHDDYAEALRGLVEEKLKAKGGKIKLDKEERRPSGAQVIDLMGALKKSLEKSGRPEGSSAKAGKAGSTAAKPKKAPARKAEKSSAAKAPARKRKSA